MKSLRRYLLHITSLSLLVLGSVFLYTHTAYAQVDLGLNFASGIGLGDEDPRIVAARIIRILLGFLGIIAIGLILYAGFIWMNSAGNEEKIDKAKKILKSATIGLLIIMASFAIASFLLIRFVQITGGGGGGTCSSCAPGEFCCSGVCQSSPCGFGGSTAFEVRGTAPSNGATNLPRNTVIRYRFSESVRSSSVDDTTFTVFEEPAHTPVSGTRTITNQYVEFVPDAMCPPPNDTLHCFSANMQIAITAVDGSVMSNSGKRLDCRGGAPCAITIDMGNYVDTQRPRITLNSNQVCAAPNNTMDASATDDSGVSKIDFYVEGSLIDSVINPGPPPLTPFNASTIWDGSSFTVGQTITLKADAFDLDSNEGSASRQVRITAGHCCNGVKDADETGIDCGGSECLACNGGACAPDINSPGVCSDAMCSSDFCTANGSDAASCAAAGFPSGTTSCCLCQSKPKITAVTPLGGFCATAPNTACRVSTQDTDCGSGNICNVTTPNGDPGNFITISGSGFGTTRGQVYFNGVRAELADHPIFGNPLCGTNVWTNNQIIAVVPTGGINGPIKVVSTTSGEDSTNDTYGALIDDFKQNTIQRPGLCIISPTAGRLNDTINYKGVKLTGSTAYFGSLSQYVQALSSNFPVPKDGTAEVPNLTTGGTTTYVSKNSVYSNFLSFTKNSEPVTGPVISSVEPPSGPIGQYVTIRGSGFGNSRGTSSVHFGDMTGPEADYNFPDVCTDSVWTDNQIIVKVPAGIALGRYVITIKRDTFAAVDSGTIKFEVTPGSPDPGLCRLDPVLGQNNSTVVLWGEYFRNQDSNSIVRFYNNRVQTGGALSFWDIDNSAPGTIKPWKVITTVPTAAISGPLRVEVGSPAQNSNTMNFTVGLCTRDQDCGPTATCCAAGLPEAGRCKADPSLCYGSVATSVFEWQFSTGYRSLSCQPGQTQCGNLCCLNGCDPTDPNKCALCPAGQNECGDGSCCNGPCIPGNGGGPSTCAASCSGYVYSQCIEGYSCPNSPGQCSPRGGGGGPIITGNCDNSVCNGLAGCGGGSCQYNSVTNRCILTATLSEGCSARNLQDGNGVPITVNGNNVVGTCTLFRNNPHWTINWSTSCPTGWSRGAGNTCIDITNKNGPCSICASTASCMMNGDRGVCAIGNPVCSSGSTCDPVDQKCKKPDLGTCECCCDINNAARDCCAGLSCDGSCGSTPNFGYCSGCVVGGVPDDDLCNCSGHDGKICDDSVDPRGRCVDCSAITNPAECSSHPRCCVDARNGNACTSLTSGQPIVPEVVGRITLNYCGFYKCTNVYPNSCNPLADKNGVYRTTTACTAACVDAPIPCSTLNNCALPNCASGTHCDLSTCTCIGNGGGGGDPCVDPNDPTACLLTGGCTIGYTCLANPPTDTCRCCCQPPSGGTPDECKNIDPSLSCLADQGLCTGASRGLCCGCTKDAICGDIALTGCSTLGSRCCASRPTVESHSPDIDANNVCRNTLIEAVFDQRMNISSFGVNDHVQLIGDYGTDPCPSGYPVVASAEPTTRLAKIKHTLKKIAVKIAPFLLTRSAFADMSNFCVVSGSAVGSEVSGTKTKVSFRLQKPLEANRTFYVVIKGDPALATLGSGTTKDYYNDGVTSAMNIGMIGTLLGHSPRDFNHTTFLNAEVWPFTTGNDICLLDSVSVSPNFYLFQKTGQEAFLNAYARSRNGQSIQGITGVYEWSWDWKSGNDTIARVDQEVDPAVAKATAGNVKDAQTLGKASATITADTVNQVSTRGNTTSGVAQLRLFLCENPWPVYFAIPGYPWPWKDDVTGVEFYYCRDQAGFGTNDDLPALQENPLIGPSGRRICMFGANIGSSCTTDTDCANATGSCLPEVLKEFFFFREATAPIPTLSGVIEPNGAAVTLSWDTVTNSTKYKIYYGLGSRRYTSSVEVNAPRRGTVSKTINNLVNGFTYYFTITALTDKNQETGFSNEVSLRPMDTIPPDKPDILASGADGKIALFWPAVTDAVNYMAYLGVTSRGPDPNFVYPVSKIVRSMPLGNNPNVVFTGLDNSATYYLAVKAIDAYGNMSPYSNEVTAQPNNPYLISADTSTRRGVRLTWLPFVGARGYTIKYTTSIIRNPVTIDVGPGTLNYLVDGLTSGVDYTFTIIAKKASGSDSNESNSITVTVH